MKRPILNREYDLGFQLEHEKSPLYLSLSLDVDRREVDGELIFDKEGA